MTDLGANNRVLCLMSEAAVANGYPKTILTRRHSFTILQMADYAFYREADSWVCRKNRYDGKTGWEPERWDLAQWLLEAKDYE